MAQRIVRSQGLGVVEEAASQSHGVRVPWGIPEALPASFPMTGSSFPILHTECPRRGGGGEVSEGQPQPCPSGPAPASLREGALLPSVLWSRSGVQHFHPSNTLEQLAGNGKAGDPSQRPVSSRCKLKQSAGADTEF